MDDRNITMEEYIRLEEEKARKRGKVFNWETAKYGKIWYDKDVHDYRSVENEFPAIVFNDSLTSNETLSCEPTVSSLNDNEIDFRISFDESDDEDYTVVFDKNSFSYKIISTNDLKTDSKNDNEKVNVPLFPSPEPTVSCIDDLDFFKDFENEFPAIVYNDALTSKSDFSTKPTLCPQHIDEFDLKDETSLSEYDEVEQNVLYFNDLFPFNIVYLDDLKSDKDNDDDEINMIQSSGGNENTHGSNKLLEGSHDKINKVFKIKSFVLELNVNIVAWNHIVNGMLFNLIKNLYMPFGILFDPKWYYKDGDCARMLRRPRAIRHMEPLPPRDQRHLWLRYQVVGYTEEIDLAERIRTVYTWDDGLEVFVSHAWRRLFGIQAPLVQEFILEFFGTCRIEDEMGLDVAGTLCFQLGGASRSMTWRQFILALGLHTAEEMAEDVFGAYWLGSERLIPAKGDLSDYWVEISSGREFLRSALSYTYIIDPVRRLCHRLISYSISGGGSHLKRHVEGRKSGAKLSGGHFIGRLAHHFGRMSDDGLRGLSVVTREILLIDMGELVAVAGALEAAVDAPAVDEGSQADPAPIQAPQSPPQPPAAGRTMPQRLGRLKKEIQGLRRDARSLRGLVERLMTDQGRVSTWMISCMTQLMEASRRFYANEDVYEHACLFRHYGHHPSRKYGISVAMHFTKVPRGKMIQYEDLPTIAPVISSAAPVVETTLVASPTGLCGLVPYSGSDSDSPDEMSSPEHISPAPSLFQHSY
ncbi:hypothetical protein Tco_0002162 [Tanacetum coccineum]